MHLLCLLTYRQVQPGSHGRLQRLPGPVSGAIFHVFLIQDTLCFEKCKIQDIIMTLLHRKVSIYEKQGLGPEAVAGETITCGSGMDVGVFARCQSAMQFAKYVCIRTCVYVYICVYIYTYIHTYIRMYIHTYINICMYACIYIYTHTHTHISRER